MAVTDIVPAREKVRELNDAFRKQPFARGKVVVTAGVNALGTEFCAAAMRAIREFDDFTEDNDPWGEHDLVVVEVHGQKLFAKIDYYDKEIKYGSEDPADLEKTTRILTIMYVSEY